MCTYYTLSVLSGCPICSQLDYVKNCNISKVCQLCLTECVMISLKQNYLPKKPVLCVYKIVDVSIDNRFSIIMSWKCQIHSSHSPTSFVEISFRRKTSGRFTRTIFLIFRQSCIYNILQSDSLHDNISLWSPHMISVLYMLQLPISVMAALPCKLNSVCFPSKNLINKFHLVKDIAIEHQIVFVLCIMICYT